jgi:hypothetical protein
MTPGITTHCDQTLLHLGRVFQEKSKAIVEAPLPQQISHLMTVLSRIESGHERSPTVSHDCTSEGSRPASNFPDRDF